MQPDVWQEKIVELQVKLEKLKKKKLSLAERIKSLDIQNKTQNSDTFNATMANQELTSLLKMQDIIQQKLEQLRFENKQEVYRVTKHDEAQVPRIPANNKRLKYMAAAPVGIMFLMLGIFLIMEIKAERIADPDALSTRVQSEVYALPPLPTARSIRKRTRFGGGRPDRAIHPAARPCPVRRLRQPVGPGEGAMRADHQRHRPRGEDDAGGPTGGAVRQRGDVNPADRRRPAPDGALLAAGCPRGRRASATCWSATSSPPRIWSFPSRGARFTCSPRARRSRTPAADFRIASSGW